MRVTDFETRTARFILRILPEEFLRWLERATLTWPSEGKRIGDAWFFLSVAQVVWRQNYPPAMERVIVAAADGRFYLPVGSTAALPFPPQFIRSEVCRRAPELVGSPNGYRVFEVEGIRFQIDSLSQDETEVRITCSCPPADGALDELLDCMQTYWPEGQSLRWIEHIKTAGKRRGRHGEEIYLGLHPLWQADQAKAIEAFVERFIQKYPDSAKDRKAIQLAVKAFKQAMRRQDRKIKP